MEYPEAQSRLLLSKPLVIFVLNKPDKQERKDIPLLLDDETSYHIADCDAWILPDSNAELCM